MGIRAGRRVSFGLPGGDDGLNMLGEHGRCRPPGIIPGAVGATRGSSGTAPSAPSNSPENGETPGQSGLTRGSALCAREELNLHALVGHWHLKPARLPFRHSPECFWPLSDLFKIAHSRSIASNTLITAYFHPSSCAVYPPLPPTCRDTSPAAPTPSASHPPITHQTLAEDATLSATLTFTLRLSLTTLPPRLPLVSLLVGNSPRELSVWNLY